jgi:hypothetical protein
MRNFKGIKVITRKAVDLMPYTLAVGQITSSPDKTTREIKVIKMEQNEYLKMYFNKSFTFFGVDEKLNSKTGDIVLVRKLKNPSSEQKLFSVEKILFEIGNIIDPITGRSNKYESDILKEHMQQLINKKN